MTTEPLVLIVDDNAQNLKLARDVLRAAGFRTLEATTGAEAIDVAGSHKPHVILMDLGLPDMSGAATTRALRATSLTADIPIVALSASRLKSGDWLREAGFAGAIEKPIDVASFPDQVRGHCAGGRQSSA